MARHRDSKGRFTKRRSSRKSFGSRTTKIMRRRSRSRRRYSTSYLARSRRTTRSLSASSSSSSSKPGKLTKPLLIVLGLVGGFYLYTKMRAAQTAAPATIAIAPNPIDAATQAAAQAANSAINSGVTQASSAMSTAMAV